METNWILCEKIHRCTRRRNEGIPGTSLTKNLFRGYWCLYMKNIDKTGGNTVCDTVVNLK